MLYLSTIQYYKFHQNLHNISIDSADLDRRITWLTQYIVYQHPELLDDHIIWSQSPNTTMIVTTIITSMIYGLVPSMLLSFTIWYIIPNMTNTKYLTRRSIRHTGFDTSHQNRVWSNLHNHNHKSSQIDQNWPKLIKITSSYHRPPDLINTQY